VKKLKNSYTKKIKVKSLIHLFTYSLILSVAQSATANLHQQMQQQIAQGSHVQAGGSRAGIGAAHHQIVMQQQYHEWRQDPLNIAADTAARMATLPVRMASSTMARSILDGTHEYGISRANLEQCQMIFMAGTMAWDMPNAGLRRPQNMTCIAEVELRQIHGMNDIVLARAFVAAGDSMTCNIDYFPESSFTPAAFQTEFPADRPPTIDEVQAVMDAERRQGAGWRIAAGAVIGGAGGALLNPENRWAGGAIGVGIGGGTMAAASYTGHVAGETIQAAVIGAAAGGAIANMMALGNRTYPAVESHETGNYLVGRCITTTPRQERHYYGFFDIATGSQMICANSDGKKINCDTNVRLSNMFVEGEDILRRARTPDDSRAFCQTPDGSMAIDNCISDSRSWFLLDGNFGDNTSVETSWQIIANQASGFCRLADAAPQRSRRLKGADLLEVCDSSGGHVSFYGVAFGGGPSTSFVQCENFEVFNRDSHDGNIIDLSNPARLRSTLTGAAIGGALSGFAAHSGATQEVQERWMAEMRRYTDSLSRVSCFTGTRFLGQYNSVVIIPPMAQ